MNAISVTVDTNIVNDETLKQIYSATEGLPIEIGKTTVTNREQKVMKNDSTDIIETTVWGESVWSNAKWGSDLPETFILDESLLDVGVLTGDSDLLEIILRTISNGSFPKKGNRDTLSNGQNRQLRDAMILQTHARESRDILVSNDIRAYGSKNSSLRSSLEKICSTKIMTSSEFIGYCSTFERS